MDKRKILDSPIKVCRYGSLCFRLNPAHFDEYSHPHLDAIFSKGLDPATGEYNIPDSAPREKILSQLRILKSKQSVCPSPKSQKLSSSSTRSSPGPSSKPTGSLPSRTTISLNHSQSSESSSYQTYITSNPGSASSSNDSFQNTTPAKPVKAEAISMKPTINQSSSPAPGKSSTASAPSKSSSGLQMKQQMKEFFQERSKQFSVKNPQSMKAKSPEPKASSSSSAQDTDALREANLDEKMKQLLPVIVPRGKMEEKLRKAAPYNMFLTTVTAAPETHNDPLSVTFQELLDPSLGELESSVQINFMIDISWLLAQYAFARCTKQPLLILYGHDEDILRDINKKRPNITSVKVHIATPFGCHHTKMMLLFYKDKSMRVVVSTANLYEDDWDNRVQGIWISDKLPALPDGVSHTIGGESVTKFREDLMRYFIAYNIPKLQPIIARIRETDFSSVKVFFVSSVPGSHRDSGKGIHYGHPRIASLLGEHSAPIDDSNPIILQASSIGNLGSTASAYLTGEIATSFKRDSAAVGLRRVPQVKLIYPSLNNVLSSHDGMAGGGCLPYNGASHDRQPWLNEHLYQWRAASRNRNQAMPHIKSYCRYSDRGLYWFVLTSANMSRSAWGTLSKGNKTLNQSLRINSYEAGVVFFPRIMVCKDRFPMTQTQQSGDVPIFKLPYDLPPLPYGKLDVPYCAEYLKAYLAKYGVS